MYIIGWVVINVKSILSRFLSFHSQKNLLYYKKVSSTPQPPNPQSWGNQGFLFVTFSCIIVLWTSYNEFLQTIMKKWFIHYIHALLLLKTWIKWSTAATLPLAGQCTAVLTVESSNSFPSGATAASAPPAGISMPCSVLPLCPLNWSTSPTATVFLPLTGISASFSLMTGHCLTASFMPWTVLFP